MPGRPARFVVVSDGSHDARSIRLLQRLDSWSPSGLLPVRRMASDKLEQYLVTHPTGKQLNLIMNLPEDRPAFYAIGCSLFPRRDALSKSCSEILRAEHVIWPIAGSRAMNVSCVETGRGRSR